MERTFWHLFGLHGTTPLLSIWNVSALEGCYCHVTNSWNVCSCSANQEIPLFYKIWRLFRMFRKSNIWALWRDNESSSHPHILVLWDPFNVTHAFTFCFPKGSVGLGKPNRNCMRMSRLSVCAAWPANISLIRSVLHYLVQSTGYEGPHCVIYMLSCFLSLLGPSFLLSILFYSIQHLIIYFSLV